MRLPVKQAKIESRGPITVIPGMISKKGIPSGTKFLAGVKQWYATIHVRIMSRPMAHEYPKKF